MKWRGIGETGTILPEHGGQTVEAIHIAITKYFAPMLIGMDRFDIGRVIDKIEGANMGRTGFPCSKSGIDNALYDITDNPIVLNADATVGLPDGPELGIAVSDAKIEKYRVLDIAL
jgi:L-alanine-DL-glutamate epimerase-like enolase superfamily enzyme